MRTQRILVPCIAALALLCSCQHAAPTPDWQSDENAYTDTVLALQNEVVAEVDTFFLAFADSLLTPSTSFLQLDSVLKRNLQKLKDLPDFQNDNRIKQGSISVCMSISQLCQQSFREMLSLDSALALQYDEQLQNRFDSLSEETFNQILQAQQKLDDLLPE